MNLVDLQKKVRQNFGSFFENLPPSLEKILDPRLEVLHFISLQILFATENSDEELS